MAPEPLDDGPAVCQCGCVDEITLRMEYDAAEVLLAALQRTSISDPEIDDLLAVRGVRATVDNATKYVPDHTRDFFRSELRAWVTHRRERGYFGLGEAAANAAAARHAMTALRDDVDLTTDVTAALGRCLPACGPLEVTVHCVVCGVSDGFVLDDDPAPEFFVAVDRSLGDAAGVKLNMTHELFHTAQQAARARVDGLSAETVDADTAPAEVRLLTTVLDEGTAVYVARAALTAGGGPYLAMWRSGYEKNAPEETMAANFSLFDRLLAGLAGGELAWDEAYAQGFGGQGPPLYFVGDAMARVIAAAHGPERIGGYFQQHPAEFFRDFLDLSPGSFSPETQAFVAGVT